MSLLGSSSLASVTAIIDNPLIQSKLKAADPTIVDGPSSPGHPFKFATVSRQLSKISGALDPKAISDKLAMVGFQIKAVLLVMDPSWFLISNVVVAAVILSIDLYNSNIEY